MEFRGESAVAPTGSRRRVYENTNIHMVMAFFMEEVTPSVRLSVTQSHRLKRLSDYHDIRHTSFSKNCPAGVSFVNIFSVTVKLYVFRRCE
jgi:hypothetical protein